MLILRVGPETVNWNILAGLQSQAREGLFSRAMAAFVQWDSPRYGEIRKELPKAIAGLRNSCAREGHRRTSTLLADVAMGWRYFLDFAIDAGAITTQAADRLWEEGRYAIGQAAAEQAEQQLSDSPARRFLDLLNGALASGNAHVASKTGGAPDEPAAWGWRPVISNSDGAAGTWKPFGDRVGWLVGDNLYLEPHAVFKAVEQFGSHSRVSLKISLDELKVRLIEAGVIVRTGEKT
jgi:hypothetical protein